MTVPTILARSPIQGIGCFAGAPIPKGATVWAFDPLIDHELESPSSWERRHAYGSKRLGCLVLPRDNAAFINFSHDPSLKEGPVSGGETTLIAARNIEDREELTVATSTDTDATWKMPRR